jgi:hypothetical protein
VPILSIWSYKKERLLASAPVKAQFDKFSFHPQKSKHVQLLLMVAVAIWTQLPADLGDLFPGEATEGTT